MMDMQANLEKLRANAAEAVLIRDSATDNSKRELYARLSVHLATLATEVERAIAIRLSNENNAASEDGIFHSGSPFLIQQSGSAA
ncbi:hypothetical protein [Bradyrhizobium sp.]|jgi:hypothetical protein|uniref:hypothetical protein n=1 Tax=Bradyrhizobium sp. TaxID=376 RepID=UPI003C5FE151